MSEPITATVSLVSLLKLKYWALMTPNPAQTRFQCVISYKKALSSLKTLISNYDDKLRVPPALSTAVNGVVHDIEVLRKGVRLISLMVSSDGFYKMSRLYVSPDNFFFKVQLLVLDTYKCSRPCPDIKLGEWEIPKYI